MSQYSDILKNKNMENDTKIQKDIMEQLDWEPFLNASQIGVTVKNGFVSLSGQVDTNSKKILAERAVNKVASVRSIAKDFRGVQFISNLISVKPKNNSFDIQKKIITAFQRSSTIDPAKIKVEVLGRMVTLTGMVSSFAQKEEAEDTAWLVPGVTSVDSELVIKDPEYSFEV